MLRFVTTAARQTADIRWRSISPLAAGRLREETVLSERYAVLVAVEFPRVRAESGSLPNRKDVFATTASNSVP